MPDNIHLLIVDPQNDFCDLPGRYLPADPLSADDEPLRPSLPVPGAHEDMRRLAGFITAAGSGLSHITLTLDSHHRVGIERPALWEQGDGSDVPPFTPITAADVRAGAYRPRDPAWRGRILAYLDALEAAGRYTHMVWPVHCEIGTWGHNVHADIHAAYSRWEERTLRVAQKVVKGSNPWTEHYSALMAEVPDTDDPGTLLNKGLMQSLARADMLLIAGEAGSHCVKATTAHLMENLGAGDLGKLVLLTDCISPVSGFETQYQDFLAEAGARGVRTATTLRILGELPAGALRRGTSAR